MGENPFHEDRTAGGSFAGSNPGHPHLGVGCVCELDKSRPQVLLQRSTGQRSAGREFLARLIGDVSDGDRFGHSSIMMCVLLKCKRPAVVNRRPRDADREARGRTGRY